MLNLAELAELVDAHVSGTCAARLGSSSLPFRIAPGLQGSRFFLFLLFKELGRKLQPSILCQTVHSIQSQ